MVCVCFVCLNTCRLTTHKYNDCVVKIAKSTYFRFSFLHIWQTIFCEVFASRARPGCKMWGDGKVRKPDNGSIGASEYLKMFRRCVFILSVRMCWCLTLAKATRGSRTNATSENQTFAIETFYNVIANLNFIFLVFLLFFWIYIDIPCHSWYTYTQYQLSKYFTVHHSFCCLRNTFSILFYNYLNG